MLIRETMDTKRISAITKRKGKERGQALIFVLLCLTCLLGFLGLATDVGTWLNAKRRIQTAADSAAIAGAAELNYGDVTAAAKADSASNGLADGANGTTVSVNNPPKNGPHANNAKYVEVIVSQSQPTFFAKLFNLNSVTVGARAVAFLGSGQGCIITLGTSGTDVSLTGNGSIQAAQCGVSANSSSSSALSASGNGSLTAKSIGVVGGYSTSGNGSVSPTPVTGMVPVNDPLAFLSEPTISGGCNTALSASSNTTVIWSQGCYSGISASGNAVVTLNPGTYILNGGSLSFTGNASVTGSGVTFFLTNGASISMSGNGALQLSAPTSGAYNSILFFQSRSDNTAESITGNGSAVLQGILYFPDSTLTLTGNGSSQLAVDLVASAVSLSGNGQLQSYATINPTSPITAGTLVE
jgi:Flp pilus assembly protein TadG